MADGNISSADITLACFGGYADCISGVKKTDVIIGSGIYEKGKIQNTKAMKKAYEMGKNV